MTDRRVRFLVAWRNYRVGMEIEPPGTLRQWLIASGFAEPVARPTPAQPEIPALLQPPPPDRSRRRA